MENAGYLRRQRLRNEKGQLTETEYTILEKPDAPEKRTEPPICENPTLEKPTLDNPILGNPTLEKPTLENRTQLNTNIPNTKKTNTDLLSIDQSITHQSNQGVTLPCRSYPCESSGSEVTDMMDAMETYREIIHENIEYEFLVERYEPERIDELVQLMLDAICSRSESIRIDRADYPAEVVKSRLLKLKAPHFEYAMDCLDKNTTKIYNIKNYLLTTLYNALTTMDHYYRAAVSHDLYGTP